MIFRQIFDSTSSTYTCLLASGSRREAVIDYKGWKSSSIGEEKKANPRLAGKTKQQYVEIMKSLKLPTPMMMDIAIPANLACGRVSAA